MNVKRIYFDMRMGQSVVFPIIAMVNFIIISYSLTSIGDVLPMRFYVPTVIASLVCVLILIGNVFRHRQQSTDYELAYERNYEMLRDIHALLSQDPDEIAARKKKIGELLEKSE